MRIGLISPGPNTGQMSKFSRDRQCFLIADIEVSAGGRDRLLADQFSDDLDVADLRLELGCLRPLCVFKARGELTALACRPSVWGRDGRRAAFCS
jgi:hypothetical protein